MSDGIGELIEREELRQRIRAVLTRPLLSIFLVYLSLKLCVSYLDVVFVVPPNSPIWFALIKASIKTVDTLIGLIGLGLVGGFIKLCWRLSQAVNTLFDPLGTPLKKTLEDSIEDAKAAFPGSSLTWSIIDQTFYGKEGRVKSIVRRIDEPGWVTLEIVPDPKKGKTQDNDKSVSRNTLQTESGTVCVRVPVRNSLVVGQRIHYAITSELGEYRYANVERLLTGKELCRDVWFD